MITFAWYLLKVIICSGILYGYYYLALRNKIFHRWNRFFLLASIVLALAVPLMKINIQKSGADKGTVVRMLQTINNGDDIIIEYSRSNGLQLSSGNIIGTGYLLISGLFLSFFLFALYKIFRLKKKYPGTRLNKINFISTDAKGTPFSFFNSIFWNNAIDLQSRQGHQIFNHEIAHVREKHTYDKVFVNVVLLFFWINPFFWLMQKELSMIHEFIADKEALDDDITAFAEMVLQTVYPGQHFSMTNNFFHSPLKRRLTMFTKNKNPKVSYASRLLVLPLATVVFFAFTLKMKTITTSNHYSGKKITVIIDAGHGGSDDGVIENNIKEKDLNLSIAKEIKELNKNENLNIILSRSGDDLMTVKDRTKFAAENKADLFVSVHMDAEENKNAHSGLNVFIPKDDNAYLKESKLLGSAIVESFKNKYQLQVNDYLQQREQGIWVLKANQYPSVLIETGFITTQTDLDYVAKPENQQTIAKNILNGIERYAEQNLTNKSDNISPVKTYGEKGKNGVVEIITKAGSTQTDTIPNPVFTKVENEADFPGGREAWTKYISKKVTAAFDSLKVVDPKNYGTCLVKFIVNTDGSVSYVEATTMKGTQLSDIAVNAIRTGPKWIPANQHGQTVASYRLQPVSLTPSK